MPRYKVEGLIGHSIIDYAEKGVDLVVQANDEEDAVQEAFDRASRNLDDADWVSAPVVQVLDDDTE